MITIKLSGAAVKAIAAREQARPLLAKLTEQAAGLGSLHVGEISREEAEELLHTARELRHYAAGAARAALNKVIDKLVRASLSA